jgi:sirohydrochlorin ferrochelatase|tara:strand:- start:1189 stop:1368 length:180 start_codon:yes stop_codon:yes gene_type:complete
MKINLWYSKGMQQWRWTLTEEFKNGKSYMEQHSGEQAELRDAMNDVANTVEYILSEKFD